MKRASVIMVILFLSVALLGAKTLEEISFGTGNDWITLGLGDNWDDGLSYGLHAAVRTTDQLLVTLALEGYTDKLTHQERYDLARLNLTYSFLFDVDHSYIRLSPIGGVLIVGNLGFQSAQNFFHRILKKDELTLAYPQADTSVHLHLGGEAVYGVRLGPTSLEGTAAVGYSTDWEFDWEAGLRGRMKRGGSYFTVAWKDAYPSGRFASQGLQTDRYEGFKLTLFHDGALLQSFFSTYPATGYSYGGWMVNALAFTRKPTFKEAHIAYGMGIFLDPTGLRNRSNEVIYKNASLEVRYKNGPIEDSWFQVASYLLGWRFDLHEGAWALPYLKVLAGLELFSLKHETRTTRDEQLHPTLVFEAGSYFGRPSQWVIGNLNYRLRLAGSIHYVIGDAKRPALPLEYQRQAPSWIFQIGIGLEIQHDLT